MQSVLGSHQIFKGWRQGNRHSFYYMGGRNGMCRCPSPSPCFLFSVPGRRRLAFSKMHRTLNTHVGKGRTNETKVENYVSNLQLVPNI